MQFVTLWRLAAHLSLCGALAALPHLASSAELVVNAEAPVAGLVPGTGYEGGARWEIGTLKLSATYGWLGWTVS